MWFNFAKWILNLRKIQNAMKEIERIRIFSWHIHGSYLYYLSQANFTIYIPVNDKKSAGYIGRGSTFHFGDNVIEVPVEEVKNILFDCILFQTPSNYLTDQYYLFNEEQRRLPKIYLEHDPPQSVPTDTPHVVNDPEVTLVHVTCFNKLMWDNGRTPAFVIDHGIYIPDVQYTGEFKKGVVVINNLKDRGRRLGSDIFEYVRQHVPLDLIGMDTEKIGGLGEILHPQLPEFISHYRFFFNPIRYTSLGLAVLEAMMTGVPVVGLATTEMTTVIENEKSGILHTDIEYLIERMKALLDNHDYARELGEAGKSVAMKRFNITRFIEDWESLLYRCVRQDAKNEKENVSMAIEMI
jgi:glycosyltransferase involved in cell wall biosynthesis